MVKVRPFRLMLWSLLVITAGGLLALYGMRVSEGNRVTYDQMIEGMADMSKSRATQDNPPVLEIWDMGWVIMCIGIIVAIPGVILMLGSATTMLIHRLVPDKPDPDALTDAEIQEREVRIARVAAGRVDDIIGSNDHEVGAELLTAEHMDEGGAAGATPREELVKRAPREHIEPLALERGDDETPGHGIDRPLGNVQNRAQEQPEFPTHNEPQREGVSDGKIHLETEVDPEPQADGNRMTEPLPGEDRPTYDLHDHDESNASDGPDETVRPDAPKQYPPSA